MSDTKTDPKTVEAVAEAPSAAEIEALASKISDHLGKSMGEQYKEYARQLTENAQKAIEGKADEASKPDAGNAYQAKTAAEWVKAMGVGEVAKPDADGPTDPVKALALGAAYMLCSKGDADRGFDKAVKAKALGKYEGFVGKALGVDDYSAGGALVPQEQATEVVGALLSETALWGDGAIRRVPVTSGSLAFPYELTPPTVRHVAENAAMNASEPAYDQVTLRPEAIGVIVPVSRKLMNSVPAMAAEVETSMRRRFEERLDEKLIRGDGTANTQLGLRYLADSSNVLNVNGTVSAANTETDLLRCQQTLTADNVPWSPATARYAISPRIWRYLFGLRGTDVHIFKQEMLAGMLLGVPIAGASQRGITNIPENLSVTDTSESEIYLYETSGLRIGVGSDLTMESSSEAAYNDSSGTVQAAFSRNQMVFKLAAEVGMVEVYRGLGIAVLSDVDWGV